MSDAITAALSRGASLSSLNGPPVSRQRPDLSRNIAVIRSCVDAVACAVSRWREPGGLAWIVWNRLVFPQEGSVRGTYPQFSTTLSLHNTYYRKLCDSVIIVVSNKK